MVNWVLILSGCWTHLIQPPQALPPSPPRQTISTTTQKKVLYAWLFVYRSQCDEAFQLMDTATLNHPKDPWLHKNYGDMAALCDSPQKASDEWSNAIQYFGLTFEEERVRLERKILSLDEP